MYFFMYKKRFWVDIKRNLFYLNSFRRKFLKKNLNGKKTVKERKENIVLVTKDWESRRVRPATLSEWGCLVLVGLPNFWRWTKEKTLVALQLTVREEIKKGKGIQERYVIVFFIVILNNNKKKGGKYIKVFEIIAFRMFVNRSKSRTKPTN